MTKDDINDLAQLSRIHLTDNELIELETQWPSIQSLFLSLESVDCLDIEPLIHPLDSALTLREDCAVPAHCQAQLSQIAPAFESGFYLVPLVISLDGAS